MIRSCTSFSASPKWIGVRFAISYVREDPRFLTKRHERNLEREACPAAFGDVDRKFGCAARIRTGPSPCRNHNRDLPEPDVRRATMNSPSGNTSATIPSQHPPMMEHQLAFLPRSVRRLRLLQGVIFTRGSMPCVSPGLRQTKWRKLPTGRVRLVPPPSFPRIIGTTRDRALACLEDRRSFQIGAFSAARISRGIAPVIPAASTFAPAVEEYRTSFGDCSSGLGGRALARYRSKQRFGGGGCSNSHQQPRAYQEASRRPMSPTLLPVRSGVSPSRPAKFRFFKARY
jgi:hypothetical protein